MSGTAGTGPPARATPARTPVRTPEDAAPAAEDVEDEEEDEDAGKVGCENSEYGVMKMAGSGASNAASGARHLGCNAAPRRPMPVDAFSPRWVLLLQETYKYMKKYANAFVSDKSWLSSLGNQLYFPMPNAALLASRGELVDTCAWLLSGCKLYILDWAAQFPGILLKHCGKDQPPCPRCFGNLPGTLSLGERLCAAARRVNLNVWAQAPRTFVDHDSTHYVFSRRYKCLACNREWGWFG